MRRAFKKLAALLIVLSLAVVVLAQSSSKLQEIVDFTKETKTKRIELKVHNSATRARLRVRSVVESGRIEWTLRDSRGVAKQNVELGRGTTNLDTGEMKAEGGVWVLELTLQNASGHYELDWVAE